MPGLVSVKTPPGSTPLRIHVTDNQIQTHESESTENPMTRSPIPRKITTPSTSRAAATKVSSPDRGSGKKKTTPEKPKMDESALDNPDLGPFLLKLARDTIASGDNPNKALDFAIRASKSFERCSIEGEPSLELAMSLLE